MLKIWPVLIFVKNRSQYALHLSFHPMSSVALQEAPVLAADLNYT